MADKWGKELLNISLKHKLMLQPHATDETRETLQISV